MSDSVGERGEFKTRITIPNDIDGPRNTWAYQPASCMNAEQSLVRAGQTDADGKFNAVPAPTRSSSATTAA